jgi:hypothetical protein
MPNVTGDLIENVVLAERSWRFRGFVWAIGLPFSALAALVIDERVLYTDDASSSCESSDDPNSGLSLSPICVLSETSQWTGVCRCRELNGDTMDSRMPFFLDAEGGDTSWLVLLTSSAEAD